MSRSSSMRIIDFDNARRLLNNKKRIILPSFTSSLTTVKVKRASVLLSVINFPTNQQSSSILFTERSESLNNHASEISFPGGMRNDDDKDDVFTSVRETGEELGLPIDLLLDQNRGLQIMGKLNDAPSLKGVIVTPIVSIFPFQLYNSIKSNPDEVKSHFTVSLDHLVDERNIIWQDLGFRGKVPSFSIPNNSSKRIWGLTGYILYDFLKSLELIKD